MEDGLTEAKIFGDDGLRVVFDGADLLAFHNRKGETPYYDWCKARGFDEMAFRLAVYRWRLDMAKKSKVRVAPKIKADEVEARVPLSRMASGGINMASIMTEQGCRCRACQTDLIANGFHLDHIIPVSKGGRNVAWNIQFLCARCNMMKSDKDPFEWSRELGIDLPDYFKKGACHV